jgi:hypothetical protein
MDVARRFADTVGVGYDSAPMGDNRLFLSQAVLDRWLGEDRVEVEGEVMTTLPDRRAFCLKTAVLFQNELTGAGDTPDLIGRVKDLDQISALGGDYAAGSVIVGDLAYEVAEGFVGEPLPDEAGIVRAPSGPHDLAAAMQRATGAGDGTSEVDLLARLFLEKR